MKKIIQTLLLILISVNLSAQTTPVQIVFDVTSSDPSTLQSAMRHVKVMSKNYPDSRFEVVMYSGSIEMVLKDKSSVAEEITSFADNENVEFKVCAMTMDRKGYSKGDLLPGIEIVPDGILEIVTKQSEGWGYIKESHK